MKRTKNVITKNGILKWLAKTILVLGIITFSGYVSEVRFNNTASPKTELKEVRRVSSKKTVYFKTACSELNASILKLYNSPENFTSFLLHQASLINVQFQSNFIAQSSKERTKGYLIYYRTHSPEEFDIKQPRG